MYQLVLRFARRLAAKPDKTGIMKIPSQQEVIDTTNDILTKFKKHNVPNEIIKTEDDVKKIFNQIQQIENQVFTKNLKQALTPHKSGDVVDLTGKKIDTSKPILGGKNVPEEKGFSMTIAEGPQTGKKITMDEFFEMSGSKTDSQIKSKLEGMNKKTVDRIRRRRYEAARKAEREKMAKDPDYLPKIIDPEDFAHGGIAGMLGERTGYFTGALADTKEGKAMSPGTRADYSPGQGHRETYGAPPGRTTAPTHIPKPPKDPNQIIEQNLATGKMMTNADLLAKQKFLNYLHAKKVYNMGEDEEGDELYDAYRTAIGSDEHMKNALVSSDFTTQQKAVDGETMFNVAVGHNTLKDLDKNWTTRDTTLQDTAGNVTTNRLTPTGMWENGEYKGHRAPQSLAIDTTSEYPYPMAGVLSPDTFSLGAGGRAGSGLNYLLGEDDQNSRVPYGGGGSGKPPVTFTLTGSGGADEGKYNYGGSFGVGGNFPLMGGEVGITGNLPFSRGSNEFGVGESTLGDQWGVNVQAKFPVDFNKMLMRKAEGGRIGFGLGGFNKARRAFLQAMGAGAAGVGAAKSGLFGLLKAGKPAVVETLTQVPIKDISGMPAWFKPLVNKIIKEGKQIDSSIERHIVHEATLPNSKTPIHVTQELDTGHVSVDIGYGKHGFADGHLGQPVALEYRASELIEPPIIKEGKVAGHGKGTKTKEEFNVEEAEFTGGHPENIKFEESTINKFGEHGSDFSEVEEFATGLKKGTGGSGHMASGGRVPLALGKIVKGGNWLIKTLRGTREAIKNSKDYSPEQINLFLKQIDDQIKNIEGGGKIPDEVIQTIRSDPKFKSVWQNQKSADPELREMEEVLLEYGTKHASGGRVPMVFGGRTIGVLKNLLTKQKKKLSIPRGEKSLRPDIFAKSIMSEEDKLKLLQLETRYADSLLESLKIDRQLFKQLQSNEAMKDEGLDFLMKHFVDTQAPHMKNYKSLADIDQAILELETLVKNKMLKEGRKPHATGGRVPLSKGKVVKGLAKLMDEFFPGTTKIGQTSKPMAPKTELKQAIAGFQQRQNITKELESFRGQIDDNIIREIAAMEPAQQLKAIEEVKFFIKSRKNLKQDLMLRDLDVTGLEPHASGGVAGMLGE